MGASGASLSVACRSPLHLKAQTPLASASNAAAIAEKQPAQFKDLHDFINGLREASDHHMLPLFQAGATGEMLEINVTIPSSEASSVVGED